VGELNYEVQRGVCHCTCLWGASISGMSLRFSVFDVAKWMSLSLQSGCPLVYIVRAAMGTERKALKGMFWRMRKDHSDWSVDQINTMYRLQRSNLKSARAWRLKEGLRSTYTTGVTSNYPDKAEAALKQWISWARRSRLEPFKKLANTLKDRLAGVVRGMLDGRSNAYVEAMNGMLQQTKRAARGFRTVKNFVAIAYLRMSRLSHATSCAAPIYHLPRWPSNSTENGIEPLVFALVFLGF